MANIRLPPALACAMKLICWEMFAMFWVKALVMVRKPMVMPIMPLSAGFMAAISPTLVTSVAMSMEPTIAMSTYSMLPMLPMMGMSTLA